MNYEVIINDQAQISGPLKAYRFRVSDLRNRAIRMTRENEPMTKFPSCPHTHDWSLAYGT